MEPVTAAKNRGRAAKRRKTSIESDNDDDVFVAEADPEDDIVEEGEFARHNCSIRLQYADYVQRTSLYLMTRKRT